MDRAEGAGLGLALVGHVALFGIVSLGLVKPPALPELKNDPIEVELVAEVAPVSSAPAASPEPAAAAPAPLAPSEPAPAPPPKPLPPAAPAIKPASKPVAKPAPPPEKPVLKAKPDKPKPPANAATTPKAKLIKTATPAAPGEQGGRRRPGLSRDLVSGLQDDATPSTSTAGATKAGSGKAATPPAQTAGPAVQSAIAAEIRRQLKPHWKSPTGADVELLRTTLAVRLNKDGSLAGQPALFAQSGVNDSNRAQARLHIDHAIKAVRLAAPFQLPPQYYDAWKEIRPNFDKRLSQ